MVEHARELVILTNVPTPYRIPFFNSLHEALNEFDATLRVFYCASREPHRHWQVPLEEQRFPWHVLPGWHPSFRGWHPHVNCSIASMLRRVQPTWLLSAGAWNLPTVLLATQRWLTCRALRIFWSESHAGAVLHPTGPIALARRRALRLYDAFAVPNQASATFVRSEVGGTATILRLPNTVEEEFFVTARTAHRRAVRARLGIPQDSHVILCVAQLEERKGVSELVAAYQQLSASARMRSMVVLLGEGSLRGSLEARARSLAIGQLRVLGHVSRDRVLEWLTAADLFILPTKFDPNPLSAIEAAFAGLPLLLTKEAGNAAELVVDGENGFVIERCSPGSITIALERFLGLESVRQRAMGARSSEMAHRGFRREIVARRFATELTALPSPADARA